MTNSNAPRDYPFAIPTTDDFRERFRYAINYWQNRNNFFDRAKAVMEGRNSIPVPQNTQYKVKVVHTRLLAALINEKAARFMHQPLIQVIPYDIGDEPRTESSDLELGIQRAFYEMEQRGDKDVWSKVIVDALLYDMGVERIERAPAAFWPELVAFEAGREDPKHPFEAENYRDNYKKEHGLPIRSVYVQPNNCFPIYEGGTCVEMFEVESRTVRNIRRNRLFDTTIFDGMVASTDNQGLDTDVTIVHYDNQNIHAYFALTPGSGGTWPKATINHMQAETNPVLLHAYEHGLGEIQYNIVAGRFGGWQESDSHGEAINKALLDLNQIADEILSQAVTAVRMRNWPTNVFEVDPALRGFQAGNAPPKAPTQPEGESISIFKGEKLSPMFEDKQDPAVPWVYGEIKELISRLGGGLAVFGAREPGVDTGYHQAQQISQAEHLDEKVEQHLGAGAINRATLLLKHIRQINEPVFVHHMVEDKVTKRKSGKYVSIDPKALTPLPQFDASVRRPRPMDFMASLRAAREASDDRGGRGPLLSDDTIRAEILGRDRPDHEEHLVLIQEQKENIRKSGLIADKVSERLNLLLTQSQSGGRVNPQDAGAADPALIAAMQQIAGSGATPGGMNPDTLSAMAAQGAPVVAPGQGGMPAPNTPGMMPGDAQPEARVGDMVAAEMFGTPR